MGEYIRIIVILGEKEKGNYRDNKNGGRKKGSISKNCSNDRREKSEYIVIIIMLEERIKRKGEYNEIVTLRMKYVNGSVSLSLSRHVEGAPHDSSIPGLWVKGRTSIKRGSKGRHN